MVKPAAKVSFLFYVMFAVSSSICIARGHYGMGAFNGFAAMAFLATFIVLGVIGESEKV